MRYHQMGDIPQKRHVQFRENGNLLVEEVLGFEGFSGNESILYHLWSPCRVKDVGDFEPIAIEEWVPDTHVHRLTNTMGLEPLGDPVLGRRVLEFNNDVEIGLCIPEAEADYFFRDGEGDEVIFVHEGGGVLETIFGSLPFREHDYVVIPRGTTYRFRFDGPQRWLTFYTPGEIETPNRYRNRYGQLLEHAPFSHRDFLPPATLETQPRAGPVRPQGPGARRLPGLRPRLPPVRRRGLGRLRLPLHVQRRRLRAEVRAPAPAAAGPPDLPGPELRDLLVLPADARLGRQRRAAALPPLERAVGGDDLLRRRAVRLAQGRRHRGDHAAPVGPPHGPQPGLVEKALGTKRTEELAVMCDTFRPLKLTTLSRDLDDPSYALSWYEEDAEHASHHDHLSPARPLVECLAGGRVGCPA